MALEPLVMVGDHWELRSEQDPEPFIPYEHEERIDIYEPIYNTWPPVYMGVGMAFEGLARFYMGLAQICLGWAQYGFQKSDTMAYVRDRRLEDPNRWNDPRADGTRRWR